MKLTALISAAALCALFAGAASAATDTPMTAAAPRSAASVECSKEADAKSLHGAERKKFRSECLTKAKAAK
jgi:hypothetical protein